MSEQKNLVEVQHLQQYFPAGGVGKNKQYVQAVDDVSFAIRKGETLGLVGESGCGKTTTGRTLLRLYEPTDGTIIYDGKVLFDSEKKINLPPQKRKVGYLFQNYALFPNMTVEENLSFPLTIQKMPKADQKAKIDDVLEIVGLTDKKKAYPGNLSG